MYEVRKIFKIQTIQKPDGFLSERQSSYLVCKMFKQSGFSPFRQDMSGKFGCLILCGQETHKPSLVEPYDNEF